MGKRHKLSTQLPTYSLQLTARLLLAAVPEGHSPTWRYLAFRLHWL